MLARAVSHRSMAPALIAVLGLIVLATLGVTLGQPDWVTPLIAIAIVVIAMMFGLRGGFAAALVASAAFFAWAIGDDGFDAADLANHRHLAFFTLGLLVGYFAHGALGDYHLGRAIVRHRLRRAIRRGELVLHYQPVAEAKTGRVTGLEALVRWEHPARGTIPPAEFVPIAEGDAQTIWELTRHTLRLAIEDCSAWRAAGHDVGVSVNLSSASVGDHRLRDEISTLLEGASMPPGRLTLEVTERAIGGGSIAIATSLSAMRAADAVAVAIDDFGTGHSSLARLEELPVDGLKIDRGFTRPTLDGRRGSLLGSIIGLAHGLGLTACAEGVEDPATWDRLVALGCDTVQGYALGRPMPPGEVVPWLERHAVAAARVRAPLGGPVLDVTRRGP